MTVSSRYSGSGGGGEGGGGWTDSSTGFGAAEVGCVGALGLAGSLIVVGAVIDIVVVEGAGRAIAVVEGAGGVIAVVEDAGGETTVEGDGCTGFGGGQVGKTEAAGSVKG